MGINLGKFFIYDFINIIILNDFFYYFLSKYSKYINLKIYYMNEERLIKF